MMHTLSRLFCLALAGTLLAGCANRYAVSQEELQRSIDQRLPMRGGLASPVVKGEVVAEAVKLDVGRTYPGRIALAATGFVSMPTALGQLRDDYQCALYGKIRFDPQNLGIYLSDVSITQLDLKRLSQLLPPQWYEAATQEARRLLVTQLAASPIYTVQDTSFGEARFQRHGSAITVEEGRIVFLFDHSSREKLIEKANEQAQGSGGRE